MKILVVLHLFSHTRHFHRVFEILLARGHSLKIVGLNTLTDQGPQAQQPAHAAHLDGAQFVLPPPPRTDAWGPRLETLRGSRNLLLYGHRRFRNAELFRRRAARFAAPLVRALTPPAGRGTIPGLPRALAAMEASAPVDPAIVEALRREAPDVLLVSPLIFNEMLSLNDWVKAAHALAIPVGFPVFSWDNLTTKGTTQATPDRIFVWNETQADEGVELHGWRREIIETLGAWRFDDFRAYRPQLTREDFCARIGFDATKPLILYLGSSPIVAPTETRFVAEWLRALRASPDPAVREAGVLIRPHPRNLTAWRDASDIADVPGVALQPLEQTSLLNTDDLFEFLHHSHAVVGLVTSAMIEAALAGRPVHSVKTTLAGAGQQGTVHFDYLTSVGGGLLHMADTLDEHVARLAPHLKRPLGEQDARSAAFVAAFVDPPTPGASASDGLADAVERLAQSRKTPSSPPPYASLGRAALATLASLGILPPRPAPPGAPEGSS
jgi:hypothetical protein